MKRILLMVLRNLFFVPYGWFKLCWYASHVDRYTEEERYRLLQYVDHRAISGGNLKIDAHGLENIPKENGFMFFPNHQGLFDVLAIIQVCPVPFSVVAKKELSDVPFLKQVFACMKAFSMDREDIKLHQPFDSFPLFVIVVNVAACLMIEFTAQLRSSLYINRQ